PALEQRPQPLRPHLERRLVVRRLAQAQIPERHIALERADASVRPEVDPLPGRVPELEGVAELRVERAEQQLEQAVVAGPGRRELDEDGPEPLAERAHLLAKGADEAEPAEVSDPPAHLDGEPEAGRRLLRPQPELRL